MSLLEKARLLSNNGFSVIPIKSKRPVLESWIDRRKRIATDQELVTWFSNGKADSIAITINNTEFALDTDGEGEQIFVDKVLPKYSEELQKKIRKTTYTRTPQGYHRTFRISKEDFPDGIPEKTYFTLNGKDRKHDEIALKGRDHYLVECGPGYITLNGIDCLATLVKEEVNELLDHLEEISPDKNASRGERSSRRHHKEEQQRRFTNSNSVAYNIDEIKVSAIVKELEPWYKIGSRDEIIFSCCGCLHKWEVSEESSNKIVTSLALNDEERESRIQTVKNTYSKPRDSNKVSGRNRFVEALSLVTNDRIKAEEIVVKIGEIVTQARKEQSGGSEFENEASRDSYDNDLEGISSDILTSLSLHVYSVVSLEPPVIYVAHNKRRQIIKAVITTFPHNQKENQQELLKWKQKLILVIPTKVEVNNNPLDGGSKTYQVTFVGKSKKPFTIGPGSISFIIDELINRGKILKKLEAVDALTAILNQYEEIGLAEVNEKIPYPGYYWIDGQIRHYEITQNLDLDPNHNEEHRKKILECIEVIEELYARNKNRIAYVTVLKWSCLAPFSYVKKYIDTTGGNWLPYLHPYGWTRTGKSTLGKIALAVCRKLTKKDGQDHIIGFGDIDSPAKLGNRLSRFTYPILVNEVGASTSEKAFPIVELIKHTVEGLTVRSAHKDYTKYTKSSALSPLILTSNIPPPSDPAYRIRVIPLRHDKVHESTEQEKEEFNEWAYDEGNIHKLGILGDFAAALLITNPELLKNKWDLVGKIILTEFYKSVGKQVPDWIDLLEKENVIEQSNEESYFALRGFLEQDIIEGYRKDVRIVSDEMVTTIEMKLSHCLEHRSVPYLFSHTPKAKGSQQEVVITWNIIPELTRHKVPNITTLPALAAEIPGFKYGNMKISGKSRKVVYGRYDAFEAFLNCKVEEDTLPQGEIHH